MPQTLLDRLTLQEKWLAARLEGIRPIKLALTILVGTLFDEQKKMADELLAPHMSTIAIVWHVGSDGPRSDAAWNDDACTMTGKLAEHCVAPSSSKSPNDASL